MNNFKTTLLIPFLLLFGCATQNNDIEKKSHQVYLETKENLNSKKNPSNDFIYSNRIVELIIKEGNNFKLSMDLNIQANSKLYIKQSLNKKENIFIQRSVVIHDNKFKNNEIFELEASIYNHYGNEYLEVIFSRVLVDSSGRARNDISTMNFVLGKRGDLVSKVFTIPQR